MSYIAWRYLMRHICHQPIVCVKRSAAPFFFKRLLRLHCFQKRKSLIYRLHDGLYSYLLQYYLLINSVIILIRIHTNMELLSTFIPLKKPLSSQRQGNVNCTAVHIWICVPLMRFAMNHETCGIQWIRAALQKRRPEKWGIRQGVDGSRQKIICMSPRSNKKSSTSKNPFPSYWIEMVPRISYIFCLIWYFHMKRLILIYTLNPWLQRF